ncbi:MAG: transcriptional regulator [Clostridia bacterium]|nr:transcriptional regulator [Clostridia bacterium]
MKEINIAKNIVELRKQRGVTQEQLASALHVSAQAVSKWETNACQPDTQMLPLIAEYFGVSVDYLFYGCMNTCAEIYQEIYTKVATHVQMSRESYEEAFNLFARAHHGISRGNLTDAERNIHEGPTHISNQNGVSLLCGEGYGAILTRSFFETVGRDTADFATTFLPPLAQKANLLVCMAILSKSEIGHEELQEKTGLDDDGLRLALGALMESSLVLRNKSPQSYRYTINPMYHTCLCVLFATIEVQRSSLYGISCCMGYGDYPIAL